MTTTNGAAKRSLANGDFLRTGPMRITGHYQLPRRRRDGTLVAMKLDRIAGAVLAAHALVGCAASSLPPECPPDKVVEPPLPREEATTASIRAFDFLRSLSGTWAVTVDGRESVTTFETVADSHAVVQKGGIFAVYHLDGSTVKLLYFPEDGYQAVLKSKGFVPVGAGDEVQFYFDMVNAVNVVPGASRVVRLVFSKADDDKIVQTWTFRGRRSEEHIVVTMTRRKPPQEVTRR